MEFNDYVEFMKKKHEGQTRIQGTPYYTHPLGVSNILKRKGFPVKYQIAGLFHDLIEDTDTTYEEILAMTDTEMVEVVKLLTKDDDYIMSEYIGNIKKSDMAKNIKIADKIHNLSEVHLAPEYLQEKTIREAEEWFIDLAKDTVFEQDIKKAIYDAKEECLCR